MALQDTTTTANMPSAGPVVVVLLVVNASEDSQGIVA